MGDSTDGNFAADLNHADSKELMLTDENIFKNSDNDLEADIPIFTIKRKPETNSPKRLKNFEWNVPLLIQDITDLKLGNNFGGPISAFGIYFKTVSVYGNAFPLGMRARNDMRLYCVDDGTGSIVVHYPHGGNKEHMNILTSISKLQHEIDLTKKNGLPSFDCYIKRTRSKRCNELIKSMDIILKKIKKHTYFPDTFFEHGAKVSAVGIPYKNPRTGEIHLYANEMVEDSGQNRDKELFFKRSLVRFYRNNLSLYKNV